jgi:hypothetical protein
MVVTLEDIINVHFTNVCSLVLFFTFGSEFDNKYVTLNDTIYHPS